MSVRPDRSKVITMRYRLRTLMIAAALGPPLLALVWFAAIWARYALPKVLLEISLPIALACMVGAVGLALYSVAAPPPGSQPAASLSLWHLAALSGVTFLALWQWLFFLCGVAGWMFLWGDNGPPYSQRIMLLFPGAIALLCAVVIAIRIRAGLATVNYVFIVWCLAALLALIAALFWVSHWLL